MAARDHFACIGTLKYGGGITDEKTSSGSYSIARELDHQSAGFSAQHNPSRNWNLGL
jgi:hypothetical protein